MTTKNILRLLLPALVLFCFGCKKFLNQPVLGNYTPDNFYTSDVNATLGVNSAYAALSFTSGGSNAIWVLGDVASDDAIKGGNPGDQADFDAINNFNITPTNGAVEAVWQRYYDGIFRCNAVIDGLPASNSAVSESVKTQVIAQAKFLRAYYYFVLTNCYGAIPLHLKVETPQELQSPALSQDTIYTQIEKDCMDASAGLPASWAATDYGRATKGAAMALLAKTYLFHATLTNHYMLAAQTAQAVEGMGYSLLPNYADNFRAATKVNAEAIFTVNHITGASPGLGNELNAWFAPRSLNGYGFFYPTQSLVNNYEKSTDGNTTDPRLDYSMARTGHPYFDTPFDPSWSTTGYITKKQVQPLSEVPNTRKNDGSVNYEAIRFADILLVEAEAFNETGKSADALVPLNKVRKRARESYLNDATLSGFGTIPAGLLADITTTDQSSLRDIIRRERRSEMALEFQRFFDVIRYGSAYATPLLKAESANFDYNTNKFFPIPQSERDTNKKLGK